MPIDYKKYPPEWKKIRERILKRAGNCCERCGVKNKSILWSVKFKSLGRWLPSKWHTIWVSSYADAIRITFAFRVTDIKDIKVVLTIAHLDHDEENWDVKDDRLAAWCQFCHLNYDLPEKMRRNFKLRMSNSNI